MKLNSKKHLIYFLKNHHDVVLSADKTSNSVQNMSKGEQKPDILNPVTVNLKNKILNIPIDHQVTAKCNMSGSQPIATSSQKLLQEEHKPDQELVQYILSLINSDRKDSGLKPVELGNNIAAQIHAEDMLKHQIMSLWTSDCMKPYMRYSLYGGTGDIRQNIASYAFAHDDMAGCQSGKLICKFEPLKWLKEDEYAMTYDDASDNWLHRDNILDSHHTHVSLGIAHDEFSLYLVQNFENNYLDIPKPVLFDPPKFVVWIQGNLLDLSKNLAPASVYYEELPAVNTYEENKGTPSYHLGLIGAPTVVDCSNEYSSQIGFSPIHDKKD